MSEYLWILFVVLAIAAAGLVAWVFTLTLPKGHQSVRLDFDLYKGREENTRFVSKGR